MGIRAGYLPLGVCTALPPPSPGSWGWAEPAARAGAGSQGPGWQGQPQTPKYLSSPLQGIQFLIENDLLKNTCEDIAQFLYKGEGLNKTAIGDYLGERCTGLGSPGGVLGSCHLREGTLQL